MCNFALLLRAVWVVFCRFWWFLWSVHEGEEKKSHIIRAPIGCVWGYRWPIAALHHTLPQLEINASLQFHWNREKDRLQCLPSQEVCGFFWTALNSMHIGHLQSAGICSVFCLEKCWFEGWQSWSRGGSADMGWLIHIDIDYAANE